MTLTRSEIEELIDNIFEYDLSTTCWSFDARTRKYLCGSVKCVISKSVVTSGYSGGSCWDDTKPKYYERDYTPPKIDFSKLPEAYFTKEAFLEIGRNLEEKSYTEYEYYGNSTNYVIQVIKYDTLVEILFNGQT